MAMNLKEIDPAVVSSATDKPKQAPPAPAPKKEIPVASKVIKNLEDEADTAKIETDFAVNCLIASLDKKIVAMPRDLAAKVPVVSVLLADQAADDQSPIPIDTTASTIIAIAHWIEHVGSASAKSETPMPEVVVYTDMSSFLHTEWEKDFDTRLLQAEHDTLLRALNFAERNGMIGLMDFCVVAVSCAIRGKSNHEMMVALCVDGDEMAAEDLEAGKAAYPWVNELIKPHEA